MSLFFFKLIYFMCYHTENPKLELIQEVFPQFKLRNNSFYSGTINAFEMPLMPVLVWEEESQEVVIDSMQWGLIPDWAKNENIAMKTLNARSETIEKVASFKNYINQRMIFITKGFYEWQWQDSKGKEKHKYYIHRKDSPLTLMAGLYNFSTKISENKYSTCTMITQDAKGIMEEIHNIKKRMPLFIMEDKIKDWLKNSMKINNFLQENSKYLNANKISSKQDQPRLF